MVIESLDGTAIPMGSARTSLGANMDKLGHCALMSWEKDANSHADYNDRGGSNNI